MLILRNKETSSYNFRVALTNLCTLLTYKVCKNLNVEKRIINTPVKDNVAAYYMSNKIVLVPILRAGLSMLDSFLNLVPGAEVNMIGAERDDENHYKARIYYAGKNISFEDKVIVLLDPMLATGNSIRAVYELIKSKNQPLKRVIVASIICYRKTLLKLSKEFPQMLFYTCACDNTLNENNYIIPGLGDAGDRYFKT